MTPLPTSNRSATTSAQSSIYDFGSKLPFAFNCTFCLIVGIGLWFLARSLTGQVGEIAAFILYIVLGSVLVGLWGVHWKQQIKITPQGLVVWNGLFRRHEVLRPDNQSTVRVSANTLEMRSISGSSMRLVRIRNSKYSHRLAELAQVIQRNVVPSE
jgi:hypothetical protein